MHVISSLPAFPKRTNKQNHNSSRWKYTTWLGTRGRTPDEERLRDKSDTTGAAMKTCIKQTWIPGSAQAPNKLASSSYLHKVPQESREAYRVWAPVQIRVTQRRPLKDVDARQHPQVLGPQAGIYGSLPGEGCVSWQFKKDPCTIPALNSSKCCMA